MKIEKIRACKARIKAYYFHRSQAGISGASKALTEAEASYRS